MIFLLVFEEGVGQQLSVEEYRTKLLIINYSSLVVQLQVLHVDPLGLFLLH